MVKTGSFPSAWSGNEHIYIYPGTSSSGPHIMPQFPSNNKVYASNMLCMNSYNSSSGNLTGLAYALVGASNTTMSIPYISGSSSQIVFSLSTCQSSGASTLPVTFSIYGLKYTN